MKARALARTVLLAAVTAAPGLAVPPSPEPIDRAEMARKVRAEMLHAWKAYETYAWGHDELRPVSAAARDWYGTPLLVTPVDALDTLLLMGLTEKADEAKALVVSKLDFDRDVSVKNFEITIRLLGGLLSSFQLTGDQRLLALADDLGRRLLPAFDSPTGMPYVNVNLRTGKTSGTTSNPAEIGTLLLELGTLSKLTGKPVYYDKAKNAVTKLYDRRSKLGLVGEEIDVVTGEWKSRRSHVGGGIDSYYEYLFKCARLFGDADCERMWKESVGALNAHLADDTPKGLWYGQADMETGRRTATEFGALHAFLPAVLALSGDLGRARRLEESCYRMWTLQGIEPEVLDYRTMTILGAGYQLRPEIVESAYTLHRLTKDPRYLEMGRTFFESLVRDCRTPRGYTVLKSVVTKEKGDLMPSYFLAETLKYLYLLFAPDETLDLGAVVFNTEAHPLRRITVEEMLRANTQAMMDAVGSGDRAVWNRLLDARVTYVDENGSVLDRKTLVDGIKPLPAGVSGTIRVTDFHADVHGDVAVTTHVDDEHETFHGHDLHCQYRTTDTWQRTPAGWRLVGGQVLALRTDPPALEVDPDDLEEYTGVYTLAPDVTYEITLTDGGLEGRQTGKKPEPLRMEAADVFFVPGKPRYRKIFLRDDDGEITGFAERREAWDLVFAKKP